jgi:glucoamylase
MARDIPVGNGDLLITFDRSTAFAISTTPTSAVSTTPTGMSSDSASGPMADFAWIEDDGWHATRGTRPTRSSPTSGSGTTAWARAHLPRRRGLPRARVPPALPHHATFRASPRCETVFMHLDLSIRGSAVGDTANYDPATSSVIVYKRRHLLPDQRERREQVRHRHWAIGTKRVGGAEGTWRDAEDGQLGRNAISPGLRRLHRRPATFRCRRTAKPYVTIWIACGSVLPGRQGP